MSICGKTLGTTRCDEPTPCRFHTEATTRSVPRVATSREDLRIGQAVAHYTAAEEWVAYEITRNVHEANWDNARFNGDVVILADPEPEPAVVPRELIDALAAATEYRGTDKPITRLADAARAVVDAARRTE